MSKMAGFLHGCYLSVIWEILSSRLDLPGERRMQYVLAVHMRSNRR